MQRGQIAIDAELWLSPLADADQDRIVRHLNDAQIARWMRQVPHPYGSTEFQTFLRIADAAAEKHGTPVHFTIHLSGQGPVGGFGFEQLCAGQSVEIGYWLGRAFQDRGIMTRVVPAACRYAIESWQVKQLTAHVFVGNAASARVLQKSGFVCEGLREQHLKKGEQWIDAQRYVLVSDRLSDGSPVTAASEGHRRVPVRGTRVGSRPGSE